MDVQLRGTSRDTSKVYSVIRAYFFFMYSRLKLHLFGIFSEFFDICSSMIFKKEREMGEWSRFLNIK